MTGYTGTVQFSCNDPQAVLPADAEIRNDGGVMQLGCCFGFALETPSLRIIDGHLPGQHFQSDMASQRYLFRFVGDAHAAAANFAEDAMEPEEWLERPGTVGRARPVAQPVTQR